MKEEALKLADCLCFIPIPKKYKQTQLEASAMIRRLVETLDNSKALADKYCKRNVELQEKITKLLDKQKYQNELLENSIKFAMLANNLQDKQGEPVAWLYDNGKWQPAVTGEEVFVESDDFTHDVRLYINGDFEDMPQKYAYATEIAKRLNTTPQTKPLSDEEIVEILKAVNLFDMKAVTRAIEERHGIK